ncbi:MAG: TetR/AcrR family transcriptional regulator [Bacteroidota bacterium]
MKKSERTRQFIIQQSAVLFNQKGYDGTTLQNIIDATGLSKGAIYGNFKKEGVDKKGVKMEIAVAAFDYAVLEINNIIGSRTRIIENTIDKLKTVVYFYKERILNPPIEGGCPILNTSIDADDNHPRLKKRVENALNEWRSRLVHTIQKGMKRGEIRKDINPGEFATQFIGTLEGGIMLARIHRDNEQFNIMARLLLQQIELIRC